MMIGQSVYCWISFVFLLLVNFYDTTAQTGVCYQTMSMRSSQNVYQRTSYTTRYRCGFWGWERCRRQENCKSYKTQYRSESRKRYYTTYAAHFGCCLGYQLSGRSSCIDIDECAEGRHQCSQNCTNTAGSYTCSCNQGFMLSRDGRTCLDIQECSKNAHQCEQICINTNGAQTCSCYPHHILSSDDHNCIVTLSTYQGLSVQNQITVAPTNGLVILDLDAQDTSYYLDCNTTQGNGGSLSWSSIPAGAKDISIIEINNGKRISFTDINMQYLGVYTCSDPIRKESVRVTLTNALLAIVPAQELEVVNIGDHVTLEVHVSGQPEVNASEIHWYHPNGSEVLVSEGFIQDDSTRYVIEAVQRVDTGRYTIMVVRMDSSTAAIHNVTTNIDVVVYDTSPIIQSPVNPTVTSENQTVTLTCSARGSPDMILTWLKDSTTLNTSSITESAYNGSMKSSTYTLGGIQKTDEGIYSCTSLDVTSGVFDHRNFTLIVQVPPEIVLQDGNIINGLQSKDGKMFSQLFTFSIIKASPPVVPSQIQWKYLNYSSQNMISLIEGPPFPEFMLSSDRQRLTLQGLIVYDAGEFVITVANSVGSASARVGLRIQVEPFLIEESSSTEEAAEGDTASFTCIADGVPLPEILWLHNGSLIVPALNRRLTVLLEVVNSTFRPGVLTAHNSTLIINDFRLRDAGEYSCTAQLDGNNEARVDISLGSMLKINESIVDYCSQQPCNNGGTCLNFKVSYLCECVREKWRGRNCEIEVNSREEPVITQPPVLDNFPSLFNKVNLTCDVIGSPQPNISWYKNGKLLEGERLPFLLINEVDLSDRGSYHCNASNSINTADSRDVVVNIKGIAQYMSELRVQTATSTSGRRKRQDQSRGQRNVINNIINELSAGLSGSVIGNATIISVQGLTPTNSSNDTNTFTVPVIVTLMSPSGGSPELTQQLETVFENTVNEISGNVIAANITFSIIQRFDGCEAEDTIIPSLEPGGISITIQWPEAAIGEVVTLPCPCGNLSAGSVRREAVRVCGGDFNSGGMWEEPLQMACNLSSTARLLCQISNPQAALPQLEGITNNAESLGSVEISLITALLESLANNPMALQDRNVSEGVLGVVDNLINVDPDQLRKSQGETRASARLLKVIGAVAMNIPIPENQTTTAIPLSLFLLAVRRVEQSEFSGQTFGVNLDQTLGLSDSQDSYGYDGNSDSSNSINIPENIFDQIGTNLTVRISNTVFLKETLFVRRNESNFTVGGIIISASIGNNSVKGLQDPIRINFTKGPVVENGTNTSCNFWDPSADGGFGDWSGMGCRVAMEIDEKVTCECDHLTNFAILLDVSPQFDSPPPPAALTYVLSTVSYIGVVISIVCLLLTILTYLISQKLRHSKNTPLLMNLCFGLLGIYITFIFSERFTKDARVCSFFGAVIHYFMLVTFLLMAAESLHLYLHLVIVIGIPSVLKYRYALKAAIISWSLPVLIVVVSFSPNWMNYRSDKFCRPFNLPFYISLVAPFVLIYIFVWIMFILILFSLICKNKEFKAQDQVKSKWMRVKRHSIIAVTLCTLFGMGWGVGLAATEGLRNRVAVTILQAIFIIITAFHGLYLFLMYCLRLEDAQNEWKSWMNVLICKGKTKPTKISLNTTEKCNKVTAMIAVSDRFEKQKKLDDTFMNNKGFSNPIENPIELDEVAAEGDSAGDLIFENENVYDNMEEESKDKTSLDNKEGIPHQSKSKLNKERKASQKL